MSKSLITLVNDVLRNAGFITGESGELTSLTDTARQVEIDIAKKVINTCISEVYSLANTPLPIEMAVSNITLVEGQREYDLPSNLVQIRYPIIFEEDQHTVPEYCGGFDKMRKDQLDPSNYTGRPQHACINPTTGLLRFDYIPTSEDVGDEYRLYYDKEMLLDVADDEIAFSDTASNHLVEVATVDWKFKRRPTVESTLIVQNKQHRNKHMALAVKYISQTQTKTSWKNA